MKCRSVGCSVAQWKNIRPWRPASSGQKGSILFVEIVDFLFWRSSEALMGGEGAQRPVWGGYELKKTGARSARARTRGQNLLVYNIDIFYL
jgi:hypothetical protein